MNKKITFCFSVLLILANIFMIGFIIDQKHPQKLPVEPTKAKVDTLVIRDTSAYAEPQNEPKQRTITEETPLPVFVTDSTAIDSLLQACSRLERRGDSLQLILLREQKHYSDSTFDAWVSGINPNLDSIRTYQTNRIISIEKTIPVKIRSRWGLGVQAGMGACKDGLTPYVGVGVSYNILSW